MEINNSYPRNTLNNNAGDPAADIDKVLNEIQTLLNQYYQDLQNNPSKAAIDQQKLKDLTNQLISVYEGVDHSQRMDLTGTIKYLQDLLMLPSSGGLNPTIIYYLGLAQGYLTGSLNDDLNEGALPQLPNQEQAYNDATNFENIMTAINAALAAGDFQKALALLQQAGPIVKDIESLLKNDPQDFGEVELSKMSSIINLYSSLQEAFQSKDMNLIYLLLGEGFSLADGLKMDLGSPR